MNKIVAGGVITVVVGMFLAATGWNFAATADIPKVYETKENVQQIAKETKQRIERVADAIEKRQERLEDKVDKLIDHLIKN
jgi:Tfp pilus assembly protein PilO